MRALFGYRRLRIGIAVSAIFVPLFAALITSGAGGSTFDLYFDDLATLLAVAAATASCIRAALRHRGRLRLFWSLLTGAAVLWAIGELGWATYDLVLSTPRPMPSWADIGYLGAIPLAVAALIVHPAFRGRTTRTIRSLLDGCTVATSVLFLAWVTVLGPLWHKTDLGKASGIITLAYPVGDIVIVVLVVLVIRGTTTRARLDLWWLLAGLLALTCSHSFYAYLTEVQRYNTGSLVDAGWFGAYVAIAIAGIVERRTHVARPDSAGLALSPAAIVGPMVPMLGALTLAAVELELGHRLDSVGWITAFVLVGLVLTRQALLIVDLLPRSGSEGDVADRLLIALGAPVADKAESAP